MLPFTDPLCIGVFCLEHIGHGHFSYMKAQAVGIFMIQSIKLLCILVISINQYKVRFMALLIKVRSQWIVKAIDSGKYGIPFVYCPDNGFVSL